jgi:hypothetical protein
MSLATTFRHEMKSRGWNRTGRSLHGKSEYERCTDNITRTVHIGKIRTQGDYDLALRYVQAVQAAWQ